MFAKGKSYGKTKNLLIREKTKASQIHVDIAGRLIEEAPGFFLDSENGATKGEKAVALRHD